MVARLQLAFGALLIAAGLVWGCVGPAFGSHFGYYGYRNGAETHHMANHCHWCAR